jgi:CheY-like chemotaxis protein
MLAGTTVLLVEDDPAIVEIVRLGLSYEGADVVVATDGLQAVQAHRDAAPDLVLLDLMLPRIDGMTVLERIRAQRDTPVIVLTARDAYVGYWPDLVRVLAPAGLLAVDNVVSHAAELTEFRALVDRDDRVAQALVPIGAGVLLIVRQPG